MSIKNDLFPLPHVIFENVLVLLERSGIKPKLDNSAEKLLDDIRHYVVQCRNIGVVNDNTWRTKPTRETIKNT